MAQEKLLNRANVLIERDELLQDFLIAFDGIIGALVYNRSEEILRYGER